VLAAAGVVVLSVEAAFTATRSTPQTLQSVADFLPPTLTAQVLGPNAAAGVVQPGAGYKVCAQVTDQGNPPSGVKSVTADLSSIAGTSSIVTLTSGLCTIGGTTYNYVADNRVAAATLQPGASVPYTVIAADNLSQSASQAFNVTVQAAPASCRAVGLTATNGGAYAQQIDGGDKMRFSFSTAVDQASIVPGWVGGGSPGPLVVKVTNAASNDVITPTYNGATTGLGTIATHTNFVNADTNYGGTLTMSGNDVVLAIDYLQFGSPVTGTASAMTWSPGAVRDTAGAACSTAPFTQPAPVANF